jgi:hypothetical protein
MADGLGVVVEMGRGEKCRPVEFEGKKLVAATLSASQESRRRVHLQQPARCKCKAARLDVFGPRTAWNCQQRLRLGIHHRYHHGAPLVAPTLHRRVPTYVFSCRGCTAGYVAAALPGCRDNIWVG